MKVSTDFCPLQPEQRQVYAAIRLGVRYNHPGRTRMHPAEWAAVCLDDCTQSELECRRASAEYWYAQIAGTEATAYRAEFHERLKGNPYPEVGTIDYWRWLLADYLDRQQKAEGSKQ